MTARPPDYLSLELLQRDEPEGTSTSGTDRSEAELLAVPLLRKRLRDCSSLIAVPMELMLELAARSQVGETTCGTDVALKPPIQVVGYESRREVGQKLPHEGAEVPGASPAPRVRRRLPREKMGIGPVQRFEPPPRASAPRIAVRVPRGQ